MASNELDRLRALASFADQICGLANDGEEARRRINHLISRSEEDIKTKSLEIQMQQSHIALLKHLDGFMSRPLDAAGQFRLGEAPGAAPGAGPRAIADRK
ncbi:MAG TPA: hypothetical protein ENH05_00915 [Rhizobiales bacterium]|nr:hypothetical protein BMS3Bbin10_00123 [bacterium BMS3Bbin10]HDO51282.1 hypothetical protein [Hyphomicrobiales bacterium]